MKKILSFVLVMLLSFMFLENVNVINEANSMEMSADMVSNASYNTTNYYYNDSSYIKMINIHHIILII